MRLKKKVRSSLTNQAGISLIELMIAITLGLIVTAVVSAVFVSSSRSFRDLQRSSEQVENGRFAISLLADDIRHAGYYGQLCNFNAAVTPACNAPTFNGTVDPCADITTTNYLDVLAYPVQLYASADFATAPSRPSCLPSTEVKAGTDILVIRRADTIALTPGTSLTVSGAKYLQANPIESEVQIGNGSALGAGKKADGTTAVILNKDGTGAPVRRLRVHIYYVSPCSQTTCGSGSDQIPTLKRMELVTGGTSPTWLTMPLVSGVEFLKVDLGVDLSPTTVNVATTYRGDGAADGSFVRALPTTPIAATWNDVVSLRVSVLVRSSEETAGYSDSGMSYALGAAGTVSGSGAFKRHVFTSEIRLNNVSGRRERILGE